MNVGKMQAAIGSVAAFLAAVLLTACAGPQSPAVRPVNQAGYSAAFKQGYADGCDSARAARRRDEQRYEKDADYMMGWNDGSSICSKRK